jgi:hypothetical protein
MPKINEPVVNIHYEGVGFSRSYLRSFKSEEDFLKAAHEEGHKHWYEGEHNRTELLKEAWALGQETPKQLEAMQKEAVGGDLGPVVDRQKADAKAKK